MSDHKGRNGSQIDALVVAGLRQMFIEGATPSMLMHHIAVHHGNDPRLHGVIGDYFWEAFRMPLLRVGSEKDYSPSPRYAQVNREIVPEMIQRISEWNRASLENSWLNGLAVHSLDEHAQRLKSTRFEALSRIWDDLNAQEKSRIVRNAAASNHQWEALKALAALAEQLQQQVVELKEQLQKKHHETNHAVIDTDVVSGRE